MSSSDESEDDCLQAAGQREPPLTIRLKGIIRDYPVESTPKEFLQNAEDAGASLFRIALDLRRFGTSTLMDPRMGPWQAGPALWFENDALFTEKDWEGIQMLNQGGKRSAIDGTSKKIGRHGLGFNSIYNLTDLPCILSGNKLMYFDPHTKYLPGVTRANPGVQVDIGKSSFKKRKLVKWADQLEPLRVFMHPDTLEGGRFSGTLMRAPLRGKAVQSDIKPESMDAVKLGMRVLETYQKDSELYLLFLRNVELLESRIIPFKGPITDFWQKRVIRRSTVGVWDGVEFRVEELEIINEPSGERVVYDVVMHQDGETAVAGARVVAKKTSSSESGGRLFCVLPMDQPSGCEAHVSSKFWPTSDRKNLYLDETTDGEPAMYCAENKKRLRNAAHALAVLIELSTKRLSKEIRRPALSLFPGHANIAPSQFFSNHFFSEILPRSPRVHCSVWGEIIYDWGFMSIVESELKANNVWFLSTCDNFLKSDAISDETIRVAFREVGLPLVELSESVLKRYKHHGFLDPPARVVRLDAGALRKRLEGRNLHHVSTDSVKVFFQICSSDNKIAEMKGICLCPTQNKNGILGTKNSPIAITNDSALRMVSHFDGADVDLFSIFSFGMAKKLLKEGLLRPLTVKFICELFNNKNFEDPKYFVGDLFKWLKNQDDIDELENCSTNILPIGEGKENKFILFKDRQFCVPSTYIKLTPVLTQLGMYVISDFAEHALLGNDNPTGCLIQGIFAAKRASRWGHLKSSAGFQGLWRELLEIFCNQQHSAPKESLAEIVSTLPLFTAWQEKEQLQSSERFKFIFCIQNFPNSLRDLRHELPKDLPVFIEEDSKVQELLLWANPALKKLKNIRDIFISHMTDLGIEIGMLDKTMKVVVKENMLTSEEMKELKFVPTADRQYQRAEDVFWWPSDFEKLNELSFLGDGLFPNLLRKEWGQDPFLVSRLRSFGLRNRMHEDEVLLLIKSIEGYVQHSSSRLMTLLLVQFMAVVQVEHGLSAKVSTELRSAKIFPISPEPEGWLPPWFGNEGFTSLDAKDFVAWEHRNLAGCVCPVLPQEFSNRMLLGIKYPQSSVLLQQLLLVANAYDDSVEWQAVATRMVEDIYEQIDKHEQPGKDILWIWTGTNFVKSEMVCRDKLASNWEPFKYHLNVKWHSLPIFAHLEESLSVESLVRIQHRMFQKQREEKVHRDNAVTTNEIGIMKQLVDALQIKGKEKFPDAMSLVNASGPITLPTLLFNTRGVLREAEEVWINDKSWDKANALYKRYPDELAHQYISPMTGLFLGGIGLRKAIANKAKDGQAQWGEASGQSQSLVVQLRNILCDYTDMAVGKEMLQNAEDAGASQFHIIYDQRYHSNKSLLTDDMGDLQGPSLYFYNNSIFSDQDWIAIKQLGVGSKKDKKDKIGRYGVGFNAVFNLTAQPTIWSGNRILFLDPQVNFLEDIGATEGKPGFSVNLGKKDVRSDFADQFAPYVALGLDTGDKFQAMGFLDGTIIRAPLREKQDEISNSILDEEKWKNLLDRTFINEGHLYLLFLKKVSKILVREISQWGRHTEVLHLTREVICSGAKKICTIRDRVSGRTWKYIIVTSPAGKVDVACLLEHNDVQVHSHSSLEKGRVFCRLPLTIGSGCSAHWSGLFWPSRDRRGIPVGEGTKESRLNEEMIRDGAFGLANLIEIRTGEMKDMQKVSLPLFPLCGNTDKCTQYFAEIFYRDVMPEYPKMLCTTWGGILQSLQEPFLASCENISLGNDLLDAFDEARVPVVLLSKEVVENCAKSQSCLNLSELSPNTLRQWLRTIHQQGDLRSFSKKTSRALLNFCVQDGKLKELLGLQLCPTKGTDKIACFGSEIVGAQTIGEEALLAHFNHPQIADLPRVQVCKFSEYGLVHKLSAKFLVDSDLATQYLHFTESECLDTNALKLLKDFYKWIQESRLSNGDLNLFNDLLMLPVLMHLKEKEKISCLKFGDRFATVSNKRQNLVTVLRECGVFVRVEFSEDSIGINAGDVNEVVTALSHKFNTKIPTPENFEKKQLWRQLLELLASAWCEHPVKKELMGNIIRHLPMFHINGLSVGLHCIGEADFVLSSENLGSLKFQKLFATQEVRVFAEKNSQVIELMTGPGRLREIRTAQELLDEKLLPTKNIRLMRVVVEERLICDENMLGIPFVPTISGQLLQPSDTLLLEERHKDDLKFSNTFEANALATDWASDSNLVCHLRRLGMRSYLLPVEIFALIKAVEECEVPAAACSVAKFLSSECLPHYNDLQKKLLRQQIHTVAWIPLEPKPNVWIGDWHNAEENTFISLGDAAQVLSSKAKFLGNACFIVSESFSPDALSFLCGQETYPPTLVVDALKKLVQAWELYCQENHSLISRFSLSRKKTSVKKLVSKMAAAMYSILTYKDISQGGLGNKTKEPWVWINSMSGTFVPSNMVSTDDKARLLSPYMYHLTGDDKLLQLPVFVNCIQEELDETSLLALLHYIREEQIEKSGEVGKHHIKVCVEALKLLYEIRGDKALLQDTDRKPLLINIDGVLHPASNIRFNDFPWEEKENIHRNHHNELVHEDVTTAIATYCGACSLKHSMLQSSAGLMMKKTWCVAKGQKQPLTQRLKRLLDQYPMESAAKEMLQNAIDSGAKQFHILADWRSYERRSVLTPEMRELQGPSLFFQNDGVFSEKDWEAIVQLGQGSKRSKVGKIGRHGLGFNSIFNFTNLPSIWSGTTHLFLDPHVYYLAKVGASHINPGIQLDLNNKKVNVQKQFNDQYAPYNALDIYKNKLKGPNFHGKIIRAPLRCPGEPTDISDEIISMERWSRVLKNLSTEAHQYLIFPEKIEKFKLISLDYKGTSFSEGFWERHEVLENRGKIITVIARHTGGVWNYRSVCTRSGDRFAEVATLISYEGPDVDKEEYWFCCGLPLRFYTGCQMHVSALFWPTQDRRVIPVGEELGGDAKIHCEENEILLELAAKASVELIEWHSEELGCKIAVDLFPRNASTPCGAHFKKVFYEKYAPCSPGMHFRLDGESLDKWEFLAMPHDNLDKDLKRAFCNEGIPVVLLTEDIICNYETHCPGDSWSRLTPSNLRAWLKKTSNVKISNSNIEPLLQFCMSDGLLTDLEGCALCPTLKGTTVKFHAKNHGSLVAWSSALEEAMLKHFDSDQIVDLPESIVRHLIPAGMLRPVDALFLKVLFEGDEQAKRAGLGDFYKWIENESPDISELDDVELICVLQSNDDKKYPLQLAPLVALQERSKCTFQKWESHIPVLRKCGVHVVMREAHCCLWKAKTDRTISALASACKDRTKSIDFEETDRELWRDLLNHFVDKCKFDRLSRSSCSVEIIGLLKQFLLWLPLFSKWENQIGQLHCCRSFKYMITLEENPNISKDLRSVLRSEFPNLDIFDESSVGVRHLLHGVSGVIDLDDSVRDLVLGYKLIPIHNKEVMRIVLTEKSFTPEELQDLDFVPTVGCPDGKPTRNTPGNAFLLDKSFGDLVEESLLPQRLCTTWANDHVVVLALQNYFSTDKQLRAYLLADEIEVVAKQIAKCKDMRKAHLLASFLNKNHASWKKTDLKQVREKLRIVPWLPVEPRPAV